MENKINKYFCIQPFVNITTRVTGETNVCCNIIQSNSNIKNESPVTFFNSKYTNEFREKMLRGEKLDACRLCHYQEDKSKNSHRIEYNKYYNIKANQTPQYYRKILERLRILDRKYPAYADIHVSNLCNLKCLTCNDKDSSRFHAESKILGVSKFPDSNFSKCEHHVKEAINSIMTKDLLFLDIRGGETLMVPEVKQILNEVDPQIAQGITLKIQTNGNIVPDATWCNIFKKFKRTKVNVSVDAYGEDINYIRYPADWTKICDTIEVLKREKIKFIINTVVSNLNVMLLDRLFEWTQAKRYLHYFYVLDGPRHYRPNNLPKALLDIAKKRLHNVKDKFVNTNNFNKIQDLIKMLENEDHAEHWHKFKQEITMRDTYRKNDITTIIPEMKEYIYA